jgi:transposase
MIRKFKIANYEETLNQTIRLAEALPPQHLARFVVDVVAQLDLSKIYEHYAPMGGEAIAPEVLLGLLFYGYATGVFSSRKIEKATYESIPFRFIAGGLHPDHDTIANFRKTFLAEIQELFVQILLLAQGAGVLKLGNISLDGSKIHADASKSHAVSYKRLIELEAQLKVEVHELFTVGEQADQGEIQLPETLILADEIAIRQERLANLAQAKKVLEARAQERYEAEKAEYDAKLREREEKAKKHHRKPKGRQPKPPEPGPSDKDQYNFTDPDSRIMKNSTNTGVDQHYNVQVANDQESLLIVAHTLSNHPNDNRKHSLPWMPFLRKSGNRKQPLWTMDTLARPTSAIARNGASTLTSPPVANLIIWIGTPFSRNNLSHPLKMPAQRSRWLTNSKLKSDKPFTAYASLR